MNYFVNTLTDTELQPAKNAKIIGLFKSCTDPYSICPDWDGEGYFCGWYSKEYYKDVLLIAYFVIVDDKSSKDTSHVVEVRNSVYFHEVGIASIYNQQTIFADSDDEAVAKFFAEDYSDSYRNIVPARCEGEPVKSVWRLNFAEHKPLDFTSHTELLKYINDQDNENGYMEYSRVPTNVEHIEYYDLIGQFDD